MACMKPIWGRRAWGLGLAEEPLLERGGGGLEVTIPQISPPRMRGSKMTTKKGTKETNGTKSICNDIKVRTRV
jgi:hypothetical protein